jgi:hypothetical protein
MVDNKTQAVMKRSSSAGRSIYDKLGEGSSGFLLKIGWQSLKQGQKPRVIRMNARALQTLFAQ